MAIQTPQAPQAVLGTLADDLATTCLALARRFWTGATMWCTAPAWPQHAHHVAVEFVHPVIMGKRALPAVAITDPDPVSALRTLARQGDMVVAVADADDPHVVAAMRRARAWGLETVWIGAGPRPEPGAADHVLWLADEDPARAPHVGSFVLIYHLLWELVHVCFEHPGLLRAENECTDEVCITCSDEGHLGEVVAIGPSSQATVRTATGPALIDTTLVAPVGLRDLVLVHAGMAIELVEGAGV